MLRTIWFGFWLLVSVFMLLVVLPWSVSEGNPLGYIIIGAIIWLSIGYVCFDKLRPKKSQQEA